MAKTGRDDDDDDGGGGGSGGEEEEEEEEEEEDPGVELKIEPKVFARPRRLPEGGERDGDVERLLLLLLLLKDESSTPCAASWGAVTESRETSPLPPTPVR